MYCFVQCIFIFIFYSHRLTVNLVLFILRLYAYWRWWLDVFINRWLPSKLIHQYFGEIKYWTKKTLYWMLREWRVHESYTFEFRFPRPSVSIPEQLSQTGCRQILQRQLNSAKYCSLHMVWEPVIWVHAFCEFLECIQVSKSLHDIVFSRHATIWNMVEFAATDSS